MLYITKTKLSLLEAGSNFYKKRDVPEFFKDKDTILSVDGKAIFADDGGTTECMLLTRNAGIAPKFEGYKRNFVPNDKLLQAIDLPEDKVALNYAVSGVHVCDKEGRLLGKTARAGLMKPQVMVYDEVTEKIVLAGKEGIVTYDVADFRPVKKCLVKSVSMELF